MVSIMNEYLGKIHLQSNDLTKNILNVAINEESNIEKKSIVIKGNRFIVDIKLSDFSIETATHIMNQFMEQSRYHYSAFFLRFNEGNMVRYRYASCKENRDGFYCDVMIH